MDQIVACIDIDCEDKKAAEEFGDGDFYLCGTCDMEIAADCPHEAAQVHAEEESGHEFNLVENDLLQRINQGLA